MTTDELLDDLVATHKKARNLAYWTGFADGFLIAALLSLFLWVIT